MSSPGSKNVLPVRRSFLVHIKPSNHNHIVWYMDEVRAQLGHLYIKYVYIHNDLKVLKVADMIKITRWRQDGSYTSKVCEKEMA